ncbi:MAG: YdiU family protein [Paracoccus sp. (in: a-proteobacteria)]|nr:YdiU family protein [Paracoccus sp. (in: a-proteobacteria)]
MIRFDNSYAKLPERMFARTLPARAPAPRLIAVNDGLAARLGIDAGWLEGPGGVDMIAGRALPEGADPLAMAYAGHQFGNFVPQLGDGRAVLLGEIVAPDGARFDLQLKGAGRTVFSRGGDGLAALGPVLREFLVSEFMHAAGVPTTRTLGAVLTGAEVMREAPLQGAVLARVAASHIRVGTFEYFAVRRDLEAIEALLEQVRARHFPSAGSPLEVLDAAIAAQAETIAHWMALGFIHGVMNTDNMALSGETIDYGPCAFMDGFAPGKVFSSIDHAGRYAYDRQPQIAVWNLAQFASCLIPLMGEENQAIRAATDAVHGFPARFEAARAARFARKLGLPCDQAAGRADTLLDLMARHEADFTATFSALTADEDTGLEEDDAFREWRRDWEAQGPDRAVMAQANPLRIPRNHRIEEVIAAGYAGDLGPFRALLGAVSAPFEARAEWDEYADPPLPRQIVRRTFCGT